MSFQTRITLKEDNMKNAEIQTTLDPNDFNFTTLDPSMTLK